MNRILEGKSILITGGTGSLGNAIVRRIATGEYGEPRTVAIFSRDELKQSIMTTEYKQKDYMRFIIGDVRDYHSLFGALWGMDYVIHAAAMKRVEACERFPDEAVKTNYIGASNLVNAVKEIKTHIECVVGVSSDKGAKPLNTYGMTKAMQEQRLIKANFEYPNTRFVCVRYGNVMGSRGSVIPIWQEQIKKGQPITITEPSMTRFLISLDQAVDALFEAIISAKKGEVYIPYSLPSTTMGDLAKIMLGGRELPIVIIGKGRGEKMHETLITEDEAERTTVRGDYYVVTDSVQAKPALEKEYISSDYVLPPAEIKAMLIKLGTIQGGDV